MLKRSETNRARALPRLQAQLRTGPHRPGSRFEQRIRPPPGRGPRTGVPGKQGHGAGRGNWQVSGKNRTVRSTRPRPAGDGSNDKPWRALSPGGTWPRLPWGGPGAASDPQAGRCRSQAAAARARPAAGVSLLATRANPRTQSSPRHPYHTRGPVVNSPNSRERNGVFSTTPAGSGRNRMSRAPRSQAATGNTRCCIAMSIEILFRVWY